MRKEPVKAGASGGKILVEQVPVVFFFYIVTKNISQKVRGSVERT